MTDLEKMSETTMSDFEKDLAIKIEKPAFKPEVSARTRDRSSGLINADITNLIGGSNINVASAFAKQKYTPEDIGLKMTEAKKTQEKTPEVVAEVENTFNAGIKETEIEQDSDFANFQKYHSKIAANVFEVDVPEEYQDKKFKIKMNLKGKLIAAVVGVATLCLMFLAIFNGAKLASLGNSIGVLESEIISQQNVLTSATDSYDKLIELGVDLGAFEKEALDNYGFIETPDQTIEFEKLEEAATTARNANQNWFDAFCNFFSRLFGIK